MTVEQFNEKYKGYLKEGHYGLSIYNDTFVSWLDDKFQEFIKIPGFTYSQVKAKFGYGRFYCEGLTEEQILEVEDKITSIS